MLAAVGKVVTPGAVGAAGLVTLLPAAVLRRDALPDGHSAVAAVGFVAWRGRCSGLRYPAGAGIGSARDAAGAGRGVSSDVVAVAPPAPRHHARGGQ